MEEAQGSYGDVKVLKTNIALTKDTNLVNV